MFLGKESGPQISYQLRTSMNYIVSYQGGIADCVTGITCLSGLRPKAVCNPERPVLEIKKGITNDHGPSCTFLKHIYISAKNLTDRHFTPISMHMIDPDASLKMWSSGAASSEAPRSTNVNSSVLRSDQTTVIHRFSPTPRMEDLSAIVRCYRGAAPTTVGHNSPPVPAVARSL